jgi:16S rRNA (uracil1498-N3)-methyltransferase
MSRRRFFVDEIRSGYAELQGEDAEHLSRVLRAQPGQRFELSDNGGLYLAEVESVEKRRVRMRVLEALPFAAPRVRLTVLAALIKFDRFEWLVEKATELGVAAIVPVAAERSDRGLEDAAVKRVERWRRIAREASQQSRRVRLPEIAGPVRLDAAARAAVGRKIYLEEAGNASVTLAAAVADATEEVTLAVGPEGGWTDRERARLVAAGFLAVTLGPTILRAETAALAAVAIASHALEHQPCGPSSP